MVWFTRNQTYMIIMHNDHMQHSFVQMMMQEPSLDIPVEKTEHVAANQKTTPLPIEKKLAAPPPIKKQEPKKNNSLMVKSPKQQPTVPKIEKKETIVQKLKPNLPVKKTVVQTKPIDQKKLPTPVPAIAQSKPQSSPPLPSKPENIATTHQKNSYNADASTYLVTLEQDIKKAWKLPVGLSPKLACTIKGSVNQQGIMSTIVIEKPSSVVTFDIAARDALSTIQFPRQLFGKELCITFNNSST